MKIKNLYIEYFRGIKVANFTTLDKHINLFVGANGAGKSSILDAIALVFSWYIARMQTIKGRGKDIPKDDISIFSPNGCTIELMMESEGKWKLYRSLKHKKTDKSDLSDMNKTVSMLREMLDCDMDMSLPIFVHYGVNRIIPNKYPRMPRGVNEETPLNAYKNALGSGLLFSDFFNWFRLSEDYENELFKSNNPYFQDPGLTAVRAAMEIVFPEYSNMRISRRPLAMMMNKGNDIFKINQLSDGEKCYITLVCDIARRLAIANPNMKNPLKGEGIILIDEIDLHLHPQWQQTVISLLVKAFPNCQFFITTHSPIVASDTDGSVFVIKDGEILKKQTFGKLSSDILSSVFGMSTTRSINVQKLIDFSYNAIKDGKEDVYSQNINRLIGILGADDLDIAGLKLEKIRQGKIRK